MGPPLGKYGVSMFKLDILEYCEPENCFKLENSYIKLLKPSYNILQIAGSPLGFIRSEKTRAKIAASMTLPPPLVGGGRELPTQP